MEEEMERKKIIIIDKGIGGIHPGSCCRGIGLIKLRN
jgi:hypothetical protein